MKEISELLKEIMGLAYEVNLKTEHNVCVDFYGNSDDFSLRIYKNGWSYMATADIAKTIYLDKNNAATKLNQAIKILEDLKGGESNDNK